MKLICFNFSKKPQPPVMPKNTSNRHHRKSTHIRENTGLLTPCPGYADFLESGTRASSADTRMQSALQPPGMNHSEPLRASTAPHLLRRAGYLLLIMELSSACHALNPKPCAPTTMCQMKLVTSALSPSLYTHRDSKEGPRSKATHAFCGNRPKE